MYTKQSGQTTTPVHQANFSTKMQCVVIAQVKITRNFKELKYLFFTLSQAYGSVSFDP